MRVLQTVLVVLLVGAVATAADDATRRELVKQRAMERAYQKKIAKAWEAFTRQFVIRQAVPIYSGPYQVGVRVVETPNYPAIRNYQRKLDLLAWNSMTDQQKRDLALFTIARNTGIIAANTAMIAEENARIAAGVNRVAAGIDEIGEQVRRDAIDQMIDHQFPRPR